jgi:hypothetical protein
MPQSIDKLVQRNTPGCGDLGSLAGAHFRKNGRCMVAAKKKECTATYF